jgi:hypothetical protein
MISREILVALLSVFAGSGCSQGVWHPSSFESHVARSQGFASNFDSADVPRDLLIVSGDWTISRDPTASSPPNVIVPAAGGEPGVAQIIVSVLTFDDPSVTVRCRTVTGTCGVSLRVHDGEDFYAVRADVANGNIALYRVAAGAWRSLASGKLGPAPGPWHELRVTASVSSLRARWDGSEVLAAEDATYRTGYVGFFTEASAPAAFDDLVALAQ